MNKILRSQLFDELTCFDGLLTRVDPALEIEAFNRFMTQPQGEIPQPDAKLTDGCILERDSIL